ncbi:MAG: hypothetical protein JXA21_07280 [Anaerolineae bacterium]|nr:hypothetical protein [Anaerolineae bacterium]
MTTSEDGTARMWDGRTPFWNVLSKHVRVSNVLAGHDGPVWDAQWSADQSRVLTAGEDGTARQFYTSPDDLLKAACEQALRNMTKDEWRAAMPGQGYRKTCTNLPTGK